MEDNESIPQKQLVEECLDKFELQRLENKILKEAAIAKDEERDRLMEKIKALEEQLALYKKELEATTLELYYYKEVFEEEKGNIKASLALFNLLNFYFYHRSRKSTGCFG
jgi:hypothetical protein